MALKPMEILGPSPNELLDLPAVEILKGCSDREKKNWKAINELGVLTRADLSQYKFLRSKIKEVKTLIDDIRSSCSGLFDSKPSAEDSTTSNLVDITGTLNSNLQFLQLEFFTLLNKITFNLLEINHTTLVEIILLKVFKGFSWEEIADDLDMNSGAIAQNQFYKAFDNDGVLKPEYIGRDSPKGWLHYEMRSKTLQDELEVPYDDIQK